MKSVRIGSLYLNKDHFADEANKTIGAVLTSSKIIENRKNVTHKVNDEGNKIKQEVISYFKKKYGLNIKLGWSKHCGCTMCPCSPGFVITANVENKPNRRMTEDDRFDIFIKDSGKLDVRKPKSEFNFSDLIELNKGK